MNGLEKITSRILNEARAEADAVIAAAQEECERIRAEYAQKAEAIRTRISDEAEREGFDMIARAKSASANEKRSAVLRMQSRVLDETFESARRQIREQSGEQYTATLTGLLCAALSEEVKAERESLELYGEEEIPVTDAYEVILNSRDRERFGEAVVRGACTKLRGVLPEEVLGKVRLADTVAAIEGGLILRYGSIETNCSLELIFEQLRSELEQDVSRALFTAPKQF